MPNVSKQRSSLKPHQSHLRADPELGRADEEEPLGEEVGEEDDVVTMWDGLYELVPGEDEIGEDKQHSAEGEQAASLEHSADKHQADDDGIDTYTDSDYALGSSGGYFYEGGAEKDYGAEEDHSEISLRLAGKSAVRLDPLEISADEIGDEEYMSCGEETHLPDEIVAGAHIVTECREEESQCHLPGTQPE